MNVRNLKPAVQKEILWKLTTMIAEHLQRDDDTLHEDIVELLLDAWVMALDQLDEEDAFGTEGWEAYFDV